MVLVVPVQILEEAKVEVLTLSVLEQLAEANAIPVIFTTFEVPAVDKVAVVKVPVPGEPAVKLILAVVDATVFEPVTL